MAMTSKGASIAVVGLGQMGSRYAWRYLDAGFALTVWNRSPQKASALIEAGARAADSPAGAIDAAEVIVAALENADAFQATLLSDAALSRVRPTHLMIDTGTVHPDSARAAHDAFAKRDARYLDAPVSGGTRGAQEGTLTILAGGDPADFERARPVLEILGTPHLVGSTGAGQIAKLANQVIVALTIGAVAEGLFLAESAGLDGARLLAALQGGFADSRILREHGDRMVRRDFAPGAANRIFLKDLSAIETLAAEVTVALPLSNRIRQAYRELIAAGKGEDDHSSYFSYLKELDNASR